MISDKMEKKEELWRIDKSIPAKPAAEPRQNFSKSKNNPFIIKSLKILSS